MMRNFQSKPAAQPVETDVQKGGPRMVRRAFGDITNSGAGAEDMRTNMNEKPFGAMGGGGGGGVVGAGGGGVGMMMQGTEMSPRIYMDRPCDDIDCKDSNNPLLASSYVNEMYKVFGQQEREYQVQHDYLSRNTLINDKMRCILVDWLVITNIIEIFMCVYIYDLFYI